MQIPIQNIYYLLCYAWNKLEEKDKVQISIDGDTSLIDLFAKVLINASSILLKRGFDRDYVSQTDEIAGIKGKIEFGLTIKRNSLHRYKAYCSYDEFSADIMHNQILYTTLYRLLYFKGLDHTLKEQIRKILLMFPPISLISLSQSHFKQARIDRNNRFYKFILNVCHIIYESSLPDEKTGEWLFQDFTRDERKMAQMFEEFVFQFFRNERPELQVSRKQFSWKFQTLNAMELEYLPIMKTDITIESEDARIIIDTKYYKETMNSRFSQDKIKSDNLYQLFSYLIHQRDGSTKFDATRGILLYPTIDEDHDLSYQFEGHQIEIKTVNLNTHWKKIEERLNYILSV
ncbi:MAG: 5-methylcytosine-specific restriction endonuclease system specificity protein McrC [Balneola sp.]